MYTNNLQAIVGQLKMCGYQCEAGNLEQNVAFQELERMANAPTQSTEDLQNFAYGLSSQQEIATVLQIVCELDTLRKIVTGALVQKQTEGADQ